MTVSSSPPARALFGTIDGIKCDAAGECGFQQPDAAEATQYAKLTQMPYNSDWMHYGNDGDHIGTLSRQFAEHVLAPLVMGEFDPSTLPPASPTTRTDHRRHGSRQSLARAAKI